MCPRGLGSPCSGSPTDFSDKFKGLSAKVQELCWDLAKTQVESGCWALLRGSSSLQGTPQVWRSLEEPDFTLGYILSSQHLGQVARSPSLAQRLGKHGLTPVR